MKKMIEIMMEILWVEKIKFFMRKEINVMADLLLEKIGLQIQLQR